MYTSLKEILREEKFITFMLFVFVVEMSLMYFSLTGISEDDKLNFGGSDSGTTTTIISRIGDDCDDRNKLTTNDFYIDKVGTCEGARIDVVVSK